MVNEHALCAGNMPSSYLPMITVDMFCYLTSVGEKKNTMLCDKVKIYLIFNNVVYLFLFSFQVLLCSWNTK